MPIDRIKCFGLEHPTSGNIIVFKAGRVKYRSKENNYKAVLIDGTNVHKKNWIHLIFTVRALYLDQQLLTADLPASLAGAFFATANSAYNSMISLSQVLNIIRNSGTTSTKFYPMLLDQNNTADLTAYEIVPDQDTYDLIDAKENGRFPMYTTLSLMTKTALTNYPTVFNR